MYSEARYAKISPSLSYREAMDKVRIPTLSERHETLSIKLFNDIVSNENHKLAHLLPLMTISHAWRLKNKRRFNTPVCRTDRFIDSFIRDLKIGRRDELGRLPEVNLLNQARAQELSTHLSAHSRPRGHDPFGQHQESRPLAPPNF